MHLSKRGHKNDGELEDLLALADPEDFLVWLGIDYQMTRGRSGVQLNIRTCPRCGGSENKVYLNADSGLGNCFHGACVDEPGFNLFSFTKAHLGTAKEAVETLKAYAKTVGWRPKKAERLSVSVATDGGVVLPECLKLPIKGRNLTYLEVRGIRAATVEALDWRFCKKGYFEYEGHDGTTRRQDYSNRVIIPVRDLQGEIKTFQGRDITGTAELRYLFPPGLAGTGQFLYNAHNALGSETVIVTEGVFDVAATVQAISEDYTGSTGVVGSFGKKISMSEQDHGSPDQLSQLFELKKAGMKRLIFLWDGEFAAIDDACKEASKLRRFGFDTYVAQLPSDKDPNECTAQEVRKALREAFPATPMKINMTRLRLRTSRA